MQVDRPATVGHLIGENRRALHIALRENVRTFEAARLALGGNAADPVERPVGGLGVVAGVFDVVPHAERDAQELVADDFVILYGVDLAAPLKPPVTVFKTVDRTVLEIAFLESARPARRRKVLRRVVATTGDQNGTAEGVFVGDRLRERLAEFIARLTTDLKIRAGLGSEATVTGAIREELRVHGVVFFHQVAHDARGADLAAPIGQRHGLGGNQIGVEEERDVGFQFHLFVEQEIPLRIRAVGIARGIFEFELLDESGLAATGFGPVAIGTDDVHFHLAGGVAAEQRAVLHEHDTRPVAGGGQGGAHAGHAASGD
jgi:hypothetical protein